jgi:hypothetical protein
MFLALFRVGYLSFVLIYFRPSYQEMYRLPVFYVLETILNLEAAVLQQNVLRSGFLAPVKRCSQMMEVVKRRKKCHFYNQLPVISCYLQGCSVCCSSVVEVIYVWKHNKQRSLNTYGYNIIKTCVSSLSIAHQQRRCLYITVITRLTSDPANEFFC